MTDKNTTTNILLSGVGGQGAILASSILASVFVDAGFDVKKSEVHGMAQRGGDVTTQFRFGPKVYSPLIKYGEVDYLLAFELIEALRYINHCRPAAKIIINEQKINPSSVNLGKAKYPDDVAAIFNKHFKGNAHIIKGQDAALALGNTQAANVVLVGAFSTFFPEISDEMWKKAIVDLLPKKIHDLNLKAFDEGKKLI
jgi:indolepyruvate ferredoxin oxidoreductase, beta subunit